MAKLGCLLWLGGTAGLGAADWYRISPGEFALRQDAQTRIDPVRFDAPLMAAAIFHASNQARQTFHLAPFVHLPKLDDAADLKAAVGVLQGDLDHANPLPSTTMPADRVEAVGLKYRRVAENLARLTVYAMRPGATEIGVRRRGEEEEYFDPKTNEPVRVNTYAGFAAAVVDAWMNSPGHRANLLNPAFTSLGVATRPCSSPLNHQPQLYAVQVFFTPR